MDNSTPSSGAPSGGDQDGLSRPGFLSWFWSSNRRRIALGSGVIAACVAVVLPVIALAGSSKPHPHSALVFTSVPTTTVPGTQQDNAADTTTTTTLAPTPTTAPATRSTTTVAEAPTTTALVCHDSYNPACGTFRWSPAPAPAERWSVTVANSSNPVVGQPVTFTVTYSDPNAVVVESCATTDWGEPAPTANQGCSLDTQCTTRYGPWDPPAKHPSSGSPAPYEHTYRNAGTYTFTVTYPAGTDCYDPYAATVSGSVTFTVAPANPPASPTTTTGS